MSQYDYLIVGAGFTGIVLAERLASIGKKILLIDKRNHVGGNCYDFYDEAGVLIHKYGPHLFRAKSEEVIKYLSEFTEWIPHRYKVKVRVKNQLYSFPVNKKTFEQFFDRNFSSETELKEFIEQLREKSIVEPKNAEEQIISKVGKEIYETFFKGYTEKQWGVNAKELDAFVTARVPIRTDYNDDYIFEKFQAMPKEGYTKMFERMLENENIETKLETEYDEELRNKATKIIWTGTIDSFYRFKLGKLPYRSLDFVFCSFYNKESVQEELAINYPERQIPYTRIVEIKHATHQTCPNTTISIEFSKSEGEPYYPMPTKEAKEIYKKYEEESKKEKDVYFVGRLGRYKYLNMDQCVEEALELFEKLEK